MYQYTSKLHRVVDGDTVDLDVDLGFAIHVLNRFRLDGINAPEMTGEQRERGKLSKAALEELLAKADKGIIYVDSTGKDKYGRWVARLTFVSSVDGGIVDVQERLIAEGFAIAAVY